MIRFLDHMNVKSISSSTFQNQHQYYLHPAVCDVWNQFHNRYLRHALQRGQSLTLGGDGRTDTPGHSAKFGSYGILDLYLMMVVDIQLVQVNLFQTIGVFTYIYCAMENIFEMLKKKHLHSHITHFQNISAETHYLCKSSKTF